MILLKKKELIIVFLMFCFLSIILFTAVPASSSSDTRYNPWADLNNDGKIDIRDLTILAIAYGAQGNPLNKTDTQDLWNKYMSYVSAYQTLRDTVNRRSFVGGNTTEMYIQPNDPEVVNLVYNITGGGWHNTSDWNEYWSDVNALYKWVRSNIEYRYDGLYPSLPYDPTTGTVYFCTDMWQFPNETLNMRKGDCEDQAILLCSMIRCLVKQQYWCECIEIQLPSTGHVAVQLPVTGHELVIFDPAGDYYSHDFWGNIVFNNVTTEIHNWLQDYWGGGSVTEVFSDYMDKAFTSTDEYTAWMYSRP